MGATYEDIKMEPFSKTTHPFELKNPKKDQDLTAAALLTVSALTSERPI